MLQPLAYADLPCLKLLGKKVGVISCGSDLRSYHLLLDELEEAGLDSHVKYMQDFVDGYDRIYDDVNEVKAKKYKSMLMWCLLDPTTLRISLTTNYSL